MIIYEKVKRFNSTTGEPFEKWGWKEVRCDYTGVVLEPESYYCAYDLNYHEMDPCFGSGNGEHQLNLDFRIEVHSFLYQTYNFLSVGGTNNKEECAEWQMMEEALKNCTNPKSEWYRCYTFDAICRVTRVRTARKLIEDKVITPEQLEGDN